jgi:hypothetical protein
VLVAQDCISYSLGQVLELICPFRVKMGRPRWRRAGFAGSAYTAVSMKPGFLVRAENGGERRFKMVASMHYSLNAPSFQGHALGKEGAKQLRGGREAPRAPGVWKTISRSDLGHMRETSWGARPSTFIRRSASFSPGTRYRPP